MSISLSGLDRAVRAEDLLAQLLTDYTGNLDARLNRLVASGVALERISVVTVESCPECRGVGYAVAHAYVGGTYQMVIRECGTCPGLCVDGTPLAVSDR